jgi:hypothetical protein
VTGRASKDILEAVEGVKAIARDKMGDPKLLVNIAIPFAV